MFRQFFFFKKSEMSSLQQFLCIEYQTEFLISHKFQCKGYISNACIFIYIKSLLWQ